MRRHRSRRHRVFVVSGSGQRHGRTLALAAALLALVASTAWSYWPVITRLFHTLRTNDDYSAGQLVPLVALFFVWRERKELRQCVLAPHWWGGISLLLFAEGARIYGFLSMRQSIERYALVLAVAALVLLVAGREILRKVLWVLLFLFLLVPLPSFIHGMISPPLQGMATAGAVFLLEAFAVGVSQQGNVVILGETTPIAVAEACNGLRMLTAFAIVAAFVAYMVKRPRWQKATLLISSIPVAVMCNIIRIFVTALLMLLVSTEVGEKFFHDFAGLVMMPAAVLLIFGELWVMDKVFVSDAEPQVGQCIARARSARQTPARKP